LILKYISGVIDFSKRLFHLFDGLGEWLLSCGTIALYGTFIIFIMGWTLDPQNKYIKRTYNEPNFGGMVLGWPLSKMCPVIPTSNQDGRHAKNRKKGG
jgi:hypothetical protein